MFRLRLLRRYLVRRHRRHRRHRRRRRRRCRYIPKEN
jgi:hypothetical protein